MTDMVEASVRSRMMAAIRGRDTVPERTVRSYLHRAGLRFRTQAWDLPGRPDIVLRTCMVAVFVHGCFWHRHPGCARAAVPASRTAFWKEKFDRNVARDRRVLLELEHRGWVCLVIWECETRDAEALDSLYWKVRAACEERAPHRRGPLSARAPECRQRAPNTGRP